MTVSLVSHGSEPGAPLAPGTTEARDLAPWHYAIIKLRADGTFGCPRPRGPLQVGHLSLVDPDASSDAERRAWRWSATLRDAMAETGQSAPADSIESRAVLRVLAGVAGESVHDAAPPRVAGTTERVLLAALALARGDADAAEAVLEPVSDLPSGPADVPLAHRLSVAFAQLGVARLRGRTHAGEALARDVRLLLAQLPVVQLDQLPGLSVMLDAHAGSLLVCAGRLHDAARVLTRGADSPAESRAGRAARADCLGQLALVEAVRGDLRCALRDARLVLEEAGDSAPAGVVPAHLAAAWVHLARGDAEPARHSLDAVTGVGPTTHEPWMVTAHAVAQARLLMHDGQPENAVRLLAPFLKTVAGEPGHGWLADLVMVVSAEACVDAGWARRALAALTPLPTQVAVEAGVVVASALLEIGDVRGARAALGGVATQADIAPLDHQVRSWLLEARIAVGEQDAGQARSLVDRALRVAAPEEMNRPFLLEAGWLRPFLERDVVLVRRHRALVEMLPREPARLPQPVPGVTLPEAVLVDHLTERESQVLELLDQMYSTDEIAHDLYVSPNTVKTHLKGIFRKLGVNRRVDAVRRGRELGLC
jgi:LuxR family maltose regulon positive regulatory protein